MANSVHKDKVMQINHRGKIAALFCNACEKACQLTPTGENINCWTEDTQMTMEELDCNATEYWKIGKMFFAVADVIE